MEIIVHDTLSALRAVAAAPAHERAAVYRERIMESRRHL
jgi:hypothetical protein